MACTTSLIVLLVTLFTQPACLTCPACLFMLVCSSKRGFDKQSLKDSVKKIHRHLIK
jgi:hypothetical protein